MDQRNNPYGLPLGRVGLPNGMSLQQQRAATQQQQYTMQDMMFDPLPMTTGLYHPPPPLHQQHTGMGGIMQQQQQQQPSMVAPEDDPRFVDDLLGAFGNDPVGQQLHQHQHMDQMPSHVYNQQQHLMAPPPSQTSNLLSGRIPGIPMTSQPLPMQQSGLPGSMHMNQMGVGADGCIGPGVPHQLPNMSAAPAISPGLGGHGISIQAPPLVAPRQQAPTAIVPTLATPKFSDSSRTLTTSSNNGGSSDEDAGMGEGDVQKKKERRRQQVRYASRRRRKKQKDEESFLRDRIAELKEQIRIIGGDLTEQCSQMAGMSEQALTEAYEKQMVTVQTLRKDNNKLKEQLLQHENFARMIQYGLNALPSDCRDVDRKKIAGVPMWISDQMNPLKGPTLVVDLNLCHEAVRHAYNELKTFGPTVNSKTNVCYAMGWKTELWAASTCLNFRAVRSISDKNIREVANASWDIITCPEKCKRIYPDVKQFRILQKVTDDIVVVHRIASVASDLSDREFISVAFRLRDGDDYYIGLKSITVQAEAAENCTRGEECQGWMFIGGDNETSPWKAHFLGYYDVKGEKDDKVLNQLANESMFGMLRWESESMHPLSV
uniref:BZIP domain-containing protein n=1 Tax=Peronospora matthiolae TaxID=2874970 RepID=A0AAV1ULK3_9STRA